MKLKINTPLLFIFFALGFSVMLLTADFSAISVTLPALSKEFAVNKESLGVILNLYLLFFVVLMIPGGRLADYLGRKKVFLFGLFLFALASLVAGLTDHFKVFVAARALQGMGASLFFHASLGICYGVVPQNKQSFAVGLLLAMAGIGFAAGSFFANALIEALDWRFVFFTPVAIASFAFILALFQLENEGIENKESLGDTFGLITLIMVICSFLFALQRSTVFGLLSFPVLLWFLFSFVCFLLMVFVERKVESPLIPRELFSNRSFWVALLLITVIAPAFFSELLFLPQFMQKFLGFTPMLSSLGLLPIWMIWALISPVAGDLYSYFGGKLLVVIATFLIAAGAFLFGFVGSENSYFLLLPGLILSGIGFGFGFTCITNLGMSAVDESKSSFAGGVLYTFLILGGLLGLSFSREIFLVVSRLVLSSQIEHFAFVFDESQRKMAEDFLINHSSFFSFSHQNEFLDKFPLVDFLKVAFSKGFFASMLFSALSALVGALLACFYLKPPPKKDSF
jgi:MFS family permease